MSYKELSPGQQIVYETHFKRFAPTQFENKDKDMPNEVHVARPDYQITASDDYQAVTREPKVTT